MEPSNQGPSAEVHTVSSSLPSLPNIPSPAIPHCAAAPNSLPLLSPQTFAPPTIPPSVPAEGKATQVLSHSFQNVYDRFHTLRTNNQYGSAYIHYLCELHVFEVTQALGIQAGGVGAGVVLEGTAVDRDTIVEWLGIPPSTFSGIATEFRKARIAHRLLRREAPNITPEEGTIKSMLDAMLSPRILLFAPMGSEVSPAASRAMTIATGKFQKLMKKVCTRLDPDCLE